MPHPPTSAEDGAGARSPVIKVRVRELRQLFNATGPSPFRERDLDPRAEEFIVDQNTASTDAWRSDWPSVSAAGAQTARVAADTAGDESVKLRSSGHGVGSPDPLA